MATSWVPHIESFVDSTRPPAQQNASLDAIATLIKNDLVSIEALVKEMAMYLTTTDNVLRTRGILLIAEVLKCLATKKLDHGIIHSLIGFFTDRLADWQALHGALVGCLVLLRRKGNVGVVIDSDAKALAQSFLQNIQVRALGKDDRKLCFEIYECLFERYPATVATLGDDLLYGICEAIDEEMDPHCLLITFHLVELLAQLFPDPSGPLAGFAEELFGILGRYFPIHFTHPDDNFNIKRDDLARALMLAFSSTPLYEPFAIPMLLEKLSSSLPAAKVDSLRYLGSCIVKYGTDRMKKHSTTIWSSLKEAIFTSSPEEPIFSGLSELDGEKIHENEIAKEAKICLQKFIFQDDGSVLGLIFGDTEIDMILSSIISSKSYNNISKESKQQLYALGSILCTSVKVSSPCCDKVFQNFLPRLGDILGLSAENSSKGFTSDNFMGFSEELNFGALYLCVQLLIASRCLMIGSKECAPQPVSAEDTWCCLLKEYSGSLTSALHSILVTSTKGNTSKAYIHYGVKGLQTLATFPGCSSPISKLIFERILTILTSVISDSREDTFLWRLALNAIREVGIFIEQSHDPEKAKSYMAIVVERVVQLISVGESSMPLPLQLEAISVIGAAGQNFMLRVSEVLEEAISKNLFCGSIEGNLKSAEIVGPLLKCYSNKVLSWFHNSGDFEKVAFRFAFGIWNQVESNKSFNFGVQGKELLGEMMTAMKLAVADCSEETQGLIVQKAYGVLESSTSFPLKEPVSEPNKVLQSSESVYSLPSRDDLVISLFASVVIALRPKTPIANVREILKFFTIMLLKGHVPSAQALGSIINKMGVFSNMGVSNACTLEEAMDTIFNNGLQSALSSYSLKDIPMDNGDEGHLDLCSDVDNSCIGLQANAIVGLTWIGKGLLMRGHQKLKQIVMVLLRCLLSTGSLPVKQELLGGCEEDYMHLVLIRSAVDAFDVLLSDSHVCLNKRFHATIRLLYKQHFFSTMMPILLSSIKDSHSSATRSTLYRAFGHVISNTPVSAVVTDSKRVISALLDSLSLLSLDDRDKDLMYSLLLVLSGIIMDDNGQEAVIENASIIVNRLIGLISFRPMMLVRETAIQCLVAMSGLPHIKIYPMRMQVLQAITSALDDPKRAVRQEAARCRHAWVSLASGSTRY
ncbi:hypothetical protein MKW94_016817 [Papaver nudicaule]|uniref:MMS19 nucleotide excision repair protein n=1 Tax=Papaver nudicaule TaxID=74823 RepID=A0AA41SHZ9_PAPNU|nr:hypothetical protein [Papaver nudicaule]